MASTLTTFDPFLKELYSPDKIIEMAYKKRPFLAMVPKKEDCGGDQYVQPVAYGHTPRRSATFSSASSTVTGTGGKVKFLIPYVEDYGIAVLNRRLIKASEKNEGAFVEAMTWERDDAITAVGNSLSLALYRSSSGSLGRISGISGANLILTLGTGQAKNFEVGQSICLSSADGTGSLRDTGATVLIAAVNRSADTITVASDVTVAISGAVANDYVFCLGDHADKIEGLGGYLPSVAAGSTAFLGVNRSVDTDRLSGIRLDGSASGEVTIEDLQQLAAMIGEANGSPDVCFMSFNRYARLAKSLSGLAMYAQDARKATHGNIGFNSLQIQGPGSVIDVIPDSSCPDAYAYMLTLNTWKLVSLGKCPHLFDEDGIMIRKADADAYEIRTGYYAGLACRAPGYNGVLTF